jgi:hypothetical protein
MQIVKQAEGCVRMETSCPVICNNCVCRYNARLRANRKITAVVLSSMAR